MTFTYTHFQQCSFTHVQTISCLLVYVYASQRNAIQFLNRGSEKRYVRQVAHTNPRTTYVLLMTIHISRSTFRLPPQPHCSQRMLMFYCVLKHFPHRIHTWQQKFTNTTSQYMPCSFYQHLTYRTFTSFFAYSAILRSQLTSSCRISYFITSIKLKRS